MALTVHVRRRNDRAEVVDVGRLVLLADGTIQPIPEHFDGRDLAMLLELLEEPVRTPPRFESIRAQPHPERFLRALPLGYRSDAFWCVLEDTL